MSYISNVFNNRYGQGAVSNKSASIMNTKHKVTGNSNKNASSSAAYTKLAHQLGYTDYKVSDGTPITVYSERFGEVKNGYELLAKFHEANRRDLNQRITDVLDKNGIKLSANEKLNFTIDKDQAINVTGADNEERNRQIEQALNSSARNIGRDLINSIVAVTSFNGQINQQEYDKWEVSTLLKEKTGLNLEDLKLVDGKITGGNEKFNAIAASTKNNATNESNYLEKLMVKKVISVLSYGADRIKDIPFSIDFQNGTLIDKNVKYGFNSNDLNKWLTDVTHANSEIDITI